MYGAVPQPLWTRLGDHAAAGTTSLTLASPANWRAGDTIAVAPSDFFGVAATERLVMSADASGTRCQCDDAAWPPSAGAVCSTSPARA